MGFSGYPKLETLPAAGRRRLHKSHRELLQQLELGIESYYIFAQILLDRITDTFLFFFNLKKWKSRGASGHVRLVKDFKRTSAAKKLKITPSNLFDKVQTLEKNIIKFRNMFIQYPEKIGLNRAFSVSSSASIHLALSRNF